MNRPPDITTHAYAGETPANAEYLIRAGLRINGVEVEKVVRGDVDASGLATFHVWVKKPDREPLSTLAVHTRKGGELRYGKRV